MSDTTLSVSWKDHTSELATGYQSLLENDFLVDCTISAEGQSLKAHRLVLSACSPYFHMLFREETGKYPFIILLDASFETLKAVIDFVYRGETQISEGNLKAFLALAQSLQIKGLNAFSKNYKSKKPTCNTSENDFKGPSDGKQDTCEVESLHASHKENSGNFSQHHPHCSKDDVTPMSSVPFQGFRTPFGEDQSPQEHPRPLGCSEVPVDPEIIMKCEPVFEEFSGTRNEILNNFNSNEPTSRTFASEIDGETSSVFVDQHLNQFPSCNESSRGNMETSVMRPSQEQITKFNCKESFVQDVTRGNESSLPVILVPKTEHLEDTGREERIDDAYETEEETEPTNPDLCSRSGAMPPENDLTSHQRSAMRLWSHGSRDVNSFLAQTKLQLHEHSRKEPILKNVDRSSCNLDAYKRACTRERPYICGVCGAAFANSSNLDVHKRTHTGERPFSCKVCSMAFSQKTSLVGHMRTHTGERPFRCDVCGKAFARQSTLAVHKRRHTGERSFHCDLCGKAFIYASNLAQHKRRHAGLRR